MRGNQMQFNELTMEQQVALKNALTWFRAYRANDSMETFKTYMQAFDRACGLTGWTDAAVLEWLKAAE
jgi:hypothetical protein